MSQASLHRLLWGVLAETIPPHEWPIRPWEIPAVGLPARVATFLFRTAIGGPLPPGWDATRGPLTWTFGNDAELLALGRRHQLELAVGEPADVRIKPSVDRSLDWDVTPHAAYYRPLLAVASVDDESYAIYCDVLQLLTAIDGEEKILDALVNHGAGAVPFEDQWDWRSRIHLPKEAWRMIERVLRWAENPVEDPRKVASWLVLALEPWTPDELVPVREYPIWTDVGSRGSWSAPTEPVTDRESVADSLEVTTPETLLVVEVSRYMGSIGR